MILYFLRKNIRLFIDKCFDFFGYFWSDVMVFGRRDGYGFNGISFVKFV